MIQGSRILSRSNSDISLEAPLVPADPSVVSDAGEEELPPAGPEHGLLQPSSLPDISVSGEVTADSLAKQLFGERDIEKVSVWNEMVTQTWQDLARSGLVTDQRELLFKKYSPPETAAFLKAPALNQECSVALKGNSVIKRDDFARKNQEQLGRALCALGEAISDFLCPTNQSSLTPEVRSAVAKVNDGAKILADLFHRLSKSRRAQIMPALNLAAKDTANAIPSDELLFGTSFGDQIKKVAAMQKSSKEIIRAPLQISRRLQQPISQPDGIQEARGEHKSPSVLSQVSFEVEETLVNAEVIVGGRLARFRSQWETITSNSRILQAISGYRLPFIQQPPSQTREPSVLLTYLEEQRCSQEIARLLTKGAIEPTVDCEGQYLSSFFLIEKPSGGYRFILNLKGFNRFIHAPHFKMEDWKTVIRLISPGDYLASIDLEDAYLLVPVHQNDRKFLRFRFLGQLYQFRVLPFGLASAPYIFTKILRPVAYFLRVKGFSSVIYLDDFLLIAPSYNQCRKNIRATRQLLLSLGFLINVRKSVFSPTRSCRFLGFLFDTTSFTVSIPPDRREKLFQRTWDILTRDSCKIRYLASFIGSLISVCPAVQYGMLHTKILERVKFLALTSAGGDFEAQMSLPSLIREDLHWWKNIFADKSQENPIRSGLFTLEIFSDASLTGWGAVCSRGRSHGFWSPEEKQFHINYLELLAVFHALRCFAAQLSNSSILLRVDNSTALSYINRMGSIRFPLLSSLAREIWTWCADRNIFIYAAYIPSAQNCEADAESRILSQRQLTPFRYTGVLRKIISDEAEGVIVVPWWPAQPWFPLFNRIRAISPSLGQDYPGCREAIRQAFAYRGTPSQAIATMLASLSEATIAQYAKPIKLWWNFCKEKDIICFTPSVPVFLDFLSSQLLGVGSYATLNSYRSAISLISTNEVGSHPLVKRFFRGVAALKPQRPRYDYVWDPAPVLNYLASLYPHESLSLECLSRKLITLLALTTAAEDADACSHPDL
nr:PREDICTED: uncharacterized protein LOC105678035 [Linepithema humile]